MRFEDLGKKPAIHIHSKIPPETKEFLTTKTARCKTPLEKKDDQSPLKFVQRLCCSKDPENKDA